LAAPDRSTGGGAERGGAHEAPRAPAVDIRIRDVLLVALTVSTGSVDALSWLGLGNVFSAFMTGNFAFLGFRVAGAAGPSVPRVLAALAAFALGAALSARIVAPSRDSGVTWPPRVTLALATALVAQAAFLGLWLAVDAHPANRAGDALIAMSALAMGMQTTAAFSLGVRALFTTAATATYAVLMGDFSGWSQSSGERRRLAVVIVGLFAGAVIGGLLIVHARRWSAVFPLAMTTLVVVVAAFAFGGAWLCPRRSRPTIAP
jgi:uncharacterized membrane protein YoaK (UPF0700 family)